MACFGPLRSTVPSSAGAKEMATWVFGLFGDFTAVLVYLSSVTIFADIWKRGSVDDEPWAPCVVGVLNSTLWLLYGLPAVHEHSTFMLVLNGFGVIMMLLYLSVYLRCCVEEDRYLIGYAMFGQVSFMICLGALVFTQLQEPEDRSTAFGVVGIFTASSMYATPRRALVTVFATQSVESMSLLQTAASAINAGVWTVYSSITFDAFVFIPNVIGVLIGVVELVVFYYYTKKTQAGSRV